MNCGCVAHLYNINTDEHTSANKTESEIFRTSIFQGEVSASGFYYVKESIGRTRRAGDGKTGSW